MKKALVLAIVCALGLGFAGFAASPLSGFWSTDICFGPINIGALSVSGFESVLDLDYTVGGWIFGMTLILNDTGLDNLYFDATGNLGAFSMSSFLDFDPTASAPKFLSWENAAQVSIAGVQFYGLFAVQNIGYSVLTPLDTYKVGSGWALGAIGTAGDLKVGAEIDFNLASQLANMWYYGFGYVTTWVTYDCGAWYKGMLAIVQTQNCVCWTGFDLYAQFPFTCATVLLTANFNPTDGFHSVTFGFDDINIGIPWLLLDDVDITFHIQTKSIALDWALVYTGVCFTPYLSLDMAGTPTGAYLAGIEFNALLLTYTWNGVTFKAGEIFDNSWAGHHYGFTATGGLTTYEHGCPVDAVGTSTTVIYDEFFGVEVDGDSCCGGAFSAGVYNFFDVGAPLSSGGIFDWQETLVNLEFGIASNLTIRLSLGVDTVDINSLCIGFTFSW